MLAAIATGGPSLWLRWQALKPLCHSPRALGAAGSIPSRTTSSATGKTLMFSAAPSKDSKAGREQLFFHECAAYIET